MKRYSSRTLTLLIAAVVGWFAAPSVSAEKCEGDVPCGIISKHLCVCAPYCPKPLPKICVKIPTLCDDYCAKPLPKLCVKVPTCCDDYCPKPLPRCLPPLPCPVPCKECLK